MFVTCTVLRSTGEEGRSKDQVRGAFLCFRKLRRVSCFSERMAPVSPSYLHAAATGGANATSATAAVGAADAATASIAAGSSAACGAAAADPADTEIH